MSQKGGYDVEFLNGEPDDNVTCSICLFVLREPMQSIGCGHRYCKTCVERLQKTDKGHYVCPEDRSEMKLFPDKGREREILSKIVKCNNADNGCQWTKELRQLKDHLASDCFYNLVECPRNECNEEVIAHHLADHMSDECEYRRLWCPFCFQRYSFNLEEMEDHLLDECTRRLIPCQFANLGCEEQVHMENFIKHETDSAPYHLKLAINKISEQDEMVQLQNEKLESQESKISELELSQKNLSNSLTQIQNRIPAPIFSSNSFILKIHDFDKELDRAKKGIPMYRWFYTSRFHNLLIYIYLKGADKDYVGLYFSTTQGNFDDMIEWPMVARICSWTQNGGKLSNPHILDTSQYKENFGNVPTKGGQGFPRFTRIDEVKEDTLIVKIKLAYKY
ncbi:TNF receptor-associated factor 6-like isoform X2 [Clytia hemisphaerica]|uniref:Uncharacterized protein n=1 Tax=Clytia hemisphaerica TaxID=252671 RepID=A0A7M5X7V1_9CNID